MKLFGIPVIEHPMCQIHAPVRKHKKRRNQSDAYHARVQKKWTKRFGTTLQPIMVIAPDTGLLARPTAFAHPLYMEALKRVAIIKNFGDTK